MILESQDLTRGSLWKKILYFSIPLMLSNILQVLFNMSDIAVVGQFAGADALGAVGSTKRLKNGIMVSVDCTRGTVQTLPQ